MLFGLRATLSVSHWGRNSASGTSFQFTSSACVPRPKRFHRVARACVHTFLSIVVRLASVCGFSISWALVRQTRAELSVAFVALCCQGFCTGIQNEVDEAKSSQKGQQSVLVLASSAASVHRQVRQKPVLLGAILAWQ